MGSEKFGSGDRQDGAFCCISRVSRHMAKLVCQLRREGDDVGARKLEAAAIETVEAIRGGRL